MSKQLMLLAAGALSALAFTALPAASSAGEFVSHCSTVGGSCLGTVSAGAATLEDDSGGSAGKYTCTSITGNTSIVDTTSTGAAQLLFHGCTDELIGSSCQTAGQPNGTILTNIVISHFVYIERTPTLITGVLFTGLNMTFECAGGAVKRTVTGDIIGKIENPNCGVAATNHTIEFTKGATAGSQQYTQVTTTGTVFDLTSGPHASDATTSRLGGTAHITYNGGTKLTLTC